jgi:hypothetical protein
MNTYKWLIMPISALACLAAPAGFSAPKASADPAPLAAGYSEQYTFRINGKSIGTQSATLVSVNNGRQMWKFGINLLIPINGTRKISLKQDGTLELDKDAFPLSLTTNALVNGSPQTESLVFGANGVTTKLSPAIPSLANPIPLDGHPYLFIDNLITLISLETRANFAKQSAKYVLPEFSSSILRPLSLTLQPAADQQAAGADSKVFDATVSGNTTEYWLSNTTGAVIRMQDKAQNLEITRN